jgi:hypothetical protein
MKRLINFALFAIFLVGACVLSDAAAGHMDRMGTAMDRLAQRA